MKEMVFVKEAYDEIFRTVGTYPAESGGILLGNRDDFIVQKFVFDSKGSTGPVSYDPDVNFLNEVVKKEWEENGLALLGFVHSHPRGVSRLSGDMGNGIGDIGYIKTIFSAIPGLDHFLVPIIHPIADGGEFKMFTYMAERGKESQYKMVDKRIISSYSDDLHSENILWTNKLEDRFGKNPLKPKKLKKYNKLNDVSNEKFIETSRIEGAIDSKTMKNSHVVCIGVGGASGICEDLVRTGVGKLTAIDFDKVDESNLTTQGFYRSDIGSLKVAALGKRVKDVNPNCTYRALNKDFLKMSEQEISEVIKDADLILCMTDDFHAQKRGNLVSLKYKVPAVFAIMYEKARGAEITFNIPGVTPACHRCATSSRYNAYDSGYENDIKSAGSTVLQTHYLNAVIGMVSLAILHNEVNHVEFGNWFGHNWERNLIQLRLNNDYASLFGGKSLFEKTHTSIESRSRTHAFDSMWQTIEPEAAPQYKPCPDCGGNGDLNEVLLKRAV